MNKNQELRVYKALKNERARYEKGEMNKYEIERLRTMLKHWNNRYNDDGALGRIEELLDMRSTSKKTLTSTKKVDGWVWVDGKRYGYERKTNGGRLEALRRSELKFVVYSMDFTQKRKTKKRGEFTEERHIDKVIIPTKVFLAAIDRFNAKKSTNGDHPEEAIQVSSKKLYDWLRDWCIPFDKDTEYSWSDFEGLE